MLQADPDQQRQCRDAELQQRAGRREEPHRQVRIVHPLSEADRQRGRCRRPEDRRDVDHRRRKSDDCKDGEPDLPVESGHGPNDEAGDAAIAERRRQHTRAREIDLRQRGERDQQQERYLLDDQPGDHRQPHRIVDDEQVGRPLPAGQFWRKDAAIMPDGAIRKASPKRRRRMRHRKQRRDQMLDAAEQPCAGKSGDENSTTSQRNGGGDEPSGQADQHRRCRCRLRRQRAEMIEGEADPPSAGR